MKKQPHCGGTDSPLLRGYSSIMPRFNAIVTACVRSLAANLERIFFTCPLTVSSVIARSLAISLLASPEALQLPLNLSSHRPHAQRAGRQLPGQFASFPYGRGG